MTNDTFYTQEFRSGDSCLTRGELESLPMPFCTKNVTSSDMQSIVELTEKSTRDRLRLSINDHIDFSNDRHSEIWWEELESSVNLFAIPYYEDLD